MVTDKAIQRRQFIVDRRFQYGLIVKSVVLVSVVLIVSLILLAFIYNKLIDVALPVSVETGEVLSFGTTQLIKLSDLIWPVMVVILLSVIISSIVVYFLGVLFTHRMAGPVYRLRSDIAEMTEGTLEKKVVFREKDYFQLLAADIDCLRQQWHGAVTELKEIQQKLHDAGDGEKKDLLDRFDLILSDLLKSVS